MIEIENDDDVGTIITDLKFLIQPCEKVETKEEGEEIAKKLFRTLVANKTGIGLAANQIGIQKRVCVVNVKEPLYFTNPSYIPIPEAGKFVYLERCLSMPNQVIRTERWRQINIKADNFENDFIIDISDIPDNLIMESPDAFEIAAIQHEMDHLDGILMTDRLYRPNPINVGKKLGRNDKITIQKGNEILEIKFKKFEVYQEKGWVIIQ